jgi:hypothetical protein
MISNEKFFELAKQCQETVEICKSLTTKLTEAVNSNGQKDTLIKKANEVLETTTHKLEEAKTTVNGWQKIHADAASDIHVLLSFIKSKGLHPPKINTEIIKWNGSAV